MNSSKKPAGKKLKIWQLFVRHAHRDTSDPSKDNGLSEKGMLQCKELVDYLKNDLPAIKIQNLYSSPKKRCLETAEAIANYWGLEVQVDQRLVEHDSAKESKSEFRSRIQKLARDLPRAAKACYVTHGDILPELLKIFGSDERKIKKGNLFLLEDGKITKTNPVKKIKIGCGDKI